MRRSGKLEPEEGPREPPISRHAGALACPCARPQSARPAWPAAACLDHMSVSRGDSWGHLGAVSPAFQGPSWGGHGLPGLPGRSPPSPPEGVPANSPAAAARLYSEALLASVPRSLGVAAGPPHAAADRGCPVPGCQSLALPARQALPGPTLQPSLGLFTAPAWVGPHSLPRGGWAAPAPPRCAPALHTSYHQDQKD